MNKARPRKPYPSDVSEEEWSLGVGYLTLMNENPPQREYPLREPFNALRHVVRYGIARRAVPNDFPPWHAVHQQAHRWLAGGVFEELAQDLRAVLRLAAGRKEEPTAAIIDSRTLRSTPESSARASYDGAKRKRGWKVHMAVDTFGNLVALLVTPAVVGDREAVARLAADIKDATGDAISLAYVDQGYTGEAAADAAATEGIRLEVVKLPEAKRGFVLLTRRWVVEMSFSRAARCRRLVKDYERYATTLAGFHIIAFVGYMLKQAVNLIQGA